MINTFSCVYYEYFMLDKLIEQKYNEFLVNTKERNRKKKKYFPDYYLSRNYLHDTAFELAAKYYCGVLTDYELDCLSICCNFNIDFWKIRGYSDEEARNFVSEIQIKNSQKSKQKFKSLPKEERDKQSNTTLGYYLNKGYSKEESRILLYERQSTFSLKKCVEKYGEEEGYRVWQDRQDRWKETLNSKPQEEIDLINISKDSSSFSWALDSCDGDTIQALELYNSRSASKDSSSFSWALEKCCGDTKKALELYKQRNCKIGKGLGRGTFSKESIEFLNELYLFCSSLGLKVYWEDNEYFLYDNAKNKLLYDFSIPSLNIVIEYHGKAFHPKERDSLWKHPFNPNLTSDVVYDRDLYKQNLAKSKGFDYFCVWSDDTIGFIGKMKNIIMVKYENSNNDITRFI